MAIDDKNDGGSFINEAGTRESVKVVKTIAINPTTGASQTGLPPGRAAAASSVPVATSTEDFARLGAIAYGGSTPSVVSVASATGATTLKAANANRVGLIIANDSTAILYVLFGTGTPSATNYSFMIPAKGTTPIDRPITGYTGLVQGAWASANGFAMVTEIT
ncbi:hypothetical protein ASF69_04730 [Rhizobium sp. Leaf311]|uniref:hypothetical protein n=1 Tax=Rhizobium sp. Leaf311 TaxID=1736332 RepID=UPI0007129F09|nr:hypothetical protein [Rhizobium sp. Leaf311]KQQ46536.1 hypothetical protein ASF69_04730 [Rhizobium sp. Leaf311]